MPKFTLVSNGNRLEVEDDDCETLDRVLETFGRAFNIPANATALVDGEPAQPNTPIRDGAEVAFNRPTGQKG